jgi:hypothetical protein
MAVGKLSGVWILEILRTNYPEGVLRRTLLDQFATQLVNPRSTRGAKGRVARRLYAKLEMLQRKGMIIQEEGIIRPLAIGKTRPRGQDAPLLGTVLRRKQFLVLMAEDRPEGKDSAQLRQLRWEFLASAISEGWTVAQAAEVIGLNLTGAKEIIDRPKG